MNIILQRSDRFDKLKVKGKKKKRENHVYREFIELFVRLNNDVYTRELMELR